MTDFDSDYADADALIEGDLDMAGEAMKLPSGKRIRVRGLSRHELMFNAKGTEDSALVERRNAVSCLIHPKLTIAQVEKWQRQSSAGGDFRALSEKIRDLSDLGTGADKSDLRTDGREP